ncbi:MULTISPECIES: hypothetical protein [unclassified Roseovarius]|uniref:hypothetical protein n=1 Tax=unclassified Roseovarius TaxID=2614913 RepID=UPI00273F9FE6|nr:MULTISPECIES: hypothetical protein [unclassified Roseovarius]
MHGHTASRPASHNPIAARIAELSEEYLTASPQRREEIGEEISGMIAGRVIPMIGR